MNTVVPLTAAEQSLGLPLPHRRMEEWKWTDLRRMIDAAVTPLPGRAPDAQTIAKLLARSPFAEAHFRRVVLVNGTIDKSLSRMDGIVLEEGAPATRLTDPLLDLNAKADGAANSLFVSGNIDTPVEIIHVNAADGAFVSSRLHAEVAAGAVVTLVETFVGEGACVANPVTSYTLHKGARLDRVKVELADTRSRHLAHTIFWLGADANLNDFTLTAGAGLSRQNVNVTMLGEGVNSVINGSYLLSGKQHADTRLVVDHAVPHCTSRELFKLVMDDHARGIFQGKVIVRPDAQKTDGKQSSHALLLSETAEFDAKPELEIYADDVVCGHGATSGELNSDHMFYLKSRGIPEAEAKALLIAAFVGEAFDAVVHDGIRDALVTHAENWLAQR